MNILIIFIFIFLTVLGIIAKQREAQVLKWTKNVCCNIECEVDCIGICGSFLCRSRIHYRTVKAKGDIDHLKKELAKKESDNDR